MKGMDIKKLNQYLAGGVKPAPGVPVVAQDKKDCPCKDEAACEAGIAAPAEALTSPTVVKLKKYLGRVSDTEDAVDLTQLALSGWKNPVNPNDPLKGGQYKPHRVYPVYPFKENSLEEHDKRWHGGHYDGGACKYRQERGIDTWNKGEDPAAKADVLDMVGAKEDVKYPGASQQGNAVETMYAGGDRPWDGRLSDKSEAEVDDIAQKMASDLGDDIYSSMGDAGTFLFQNGNEIREVPVEELMSGGDLQQYIAEALPENAADLDTDAVVRDVANRAEKWIRDFYTWEDIKDKGTGYDVDEGI